MDTWDVTNTHGSGDYQETSTIKPDLVVQDVLPEVVQVKVGNLEITSNGPAAKTAVIKINGKAVAARRVVLEGSVNSAWIATVEFFPGLGDYKG